MLYLLMSSTVHNMYCDVKPKTFCNILCSVIGFLKIKVLNAQQINHHLRTLCKFLQYFYSTLCPVILFRVSLCPSPTNTLRYCLAGIQSTVSCSVGIVANQTPKSCQIRGLGFQESFSQSCLWREEGVGRGSSFIFIRLNQREAEPARRDPGGHYASLLYFIYLPFMGADLQEPTTSLNV